MLKSFLLFSSMAMMTAATPSLLADEPNHRTITVTGTGTVKVVPDEVVFTVGITVRDKDLNQLRRIGEQRSRVVLDALRGLGIADKDMSTDLVDLEPNWSHSNDRVPPTLVDYSQQINLSVTLKEVRRFNEVVTAALGAGAESIKNVEFRTSAQRAHRDEARLLALKAAREKAQALAKELGMKVGKPWTIREGSSGLASGSTWGRRYAASSNSMFEADSGALAPTESVAPGLLGIQAAVTITFDLE